MENADKEYIKGAIEALLFIGERPTMLEQIQEALETVGAADIKNLIKELQQDYETQKRGMTIIEIAGGYQMLSSPHYVSYVHNFFKTHVKEKLSRPALETLAIVAYKQPVSRGDIELIRGVNSDGVAVHLLDKGLIKIVGRKDIPGRPYLYGTSKEFLEYFGLKSLNDLPKLEEFASLQQVIEAGAAGSEERMNQVSAEIRPSADANAEVNNLNFEETPSGHDESTANAVEKSNEEAGEPENVATQESFARGEPEAVNGETENVPPAEDPLPNDVRDLKEIMDEINEERTS